MGKMRWMSKGARRKGVNLRAPATATSQASYTTTVSWTPVFGHGRVKIYTCDARLTAAATTAPRKLNGSANAALFVSSVLPKILEEMKEKYEWTTVPRVIVHEKASYFSSTASTLPLHAACVKVVFGVGLAMIAPAHSGWQPSLATCTPRDMHLPHPPLVGHNLRKQSHLGDCGAVQEAAQPGRGLQVGRGWQRLGAALPRPHPLEGRGLAQVRWAQACVETGTSTL